MAWPLRVAVRVDQQKPWLNGLRKASDDDNKDKHGVNGRPRRGRHLLTLCVAQRPLLVLPASPQPSEQERTVDDN